MHGHKSHDGMLLSLGIALGVLLSVTGCGSVEVTQNGLNPSGIESPPAATPPAAAPPTTSSVDPAPPSPATPEPDPLTIQNSPATSVDAGQHYSYVPNVTDAAGTTLHFSIENLPPWASFDANNGALTGSPADANVGVWEEITIIATADDRTGSVGPFQITVTAKPLVATPPPPVPNSPPSLQGLPATTVTVGSAYNFRPTSSDPDGDALSFTIVNRPSWAAFNSQTGQLTGTPGASQVRSYNNITISVSDGKATVTLPGFTITVQAAPALPPTGTGTNIAPTISGAPASSVVAGSIYSFSPSANDANNDTLTFSIQNKPAWATFSISNGQLSGTPTAANIGSFAGIVISVSDGKATTSLPAFAIQVQAPPNIAPVIGGTPATSVVAGSVYSFGPTASDADSNMLTFSIQNKPSWASFNASTGQLSGTPAATDVGTYAGIVISVSDGALSLALPAFSVTVNVIATGTAAANWMPPTQNTNGSALSGLTGYRLYYGISANALDQMVQIASPGTTAYTLTELASGTWYFAITAYTASGVESALSNIETKIIP